MTLLADERVRDVTRRRRALALAIEGTHVVLRVLEGGTPVIAVRLSRLRLVDLVRVLARAHDELRARETILRLHEPVP